MKRVLAYLFIALAVSCTGTVDPNAELPDNGEETPMPPVEEDQDPLDGVDEVPEGVLRIFADKTEIAANGSDEVTFTVMFGSEDVSTDKGMQLIRTFNGDKKYMMYGANKFTTVSAGTYTFSAEYYYAGKKYSDNEVTIQATQFFSGEEKDYARNVLAAYFTSTGCTSCPLASKGIKTVQENNPGEISVVAFHADMAGISDPMKTGNTEVFRLGLGNFQGLPMLFWNLRPGTNLIGPEFQTSFDAEKALYEPQCGVAIETSFDESTRELDIEVGITSNLPVVYRYLVFLVEDNMDSAVLGNAYKQCGDPYVHDNVVRDVLTSGVSGEKINQDLPFTVGVEATAAKKVKLPAHWNAKNMRVVVSAMSSSDGGYTWIANNTNECALGSSVDYEYVE